MLTQEDRDNIKKFLAKQYDIPFLTVPHDFISCEYHGCSESQVHVTRTAVNETDISKGFGMIPHVWFKGGGYMMHMLRAGLLGIPSSFWRTFWEGMFMRAIMYIRANAASAINEPFEM